MSEVSLKEFAAALRRASKAAWLIRAVVEIHAADNLDEQIARLDRFLDSWKEIFGDKPLSPEAWIRIEPPELLAARVTGRDALLEFRNAVLDVRRKARGMAEKIVPPIGERNDAWLAGLLGRLDLLNTFDFLYVPFPEQVGLPEHDGKGCYPESLTEALLEYSELSPASFRELAEHIEGKQDQWELAINELSDAGRYIENLMLVRGGCIGERPAVEAPAGEARAVEPATASVATVEAKQKKVSKAEADELARNYLFIDKRPWPGVRTLAAEINYHDSRILELPSVQEHKKEHAEQWPAYSPKTIGISEANENSLSVGGKDEVLNEVIAREEAELELQRLAAEREKLETERQRLADIEKAAEAQAAEHRADFAPRKVMGKSIGRRRKA